jgi:hypothetical protein
VELDYRVDPSLACPSEEEVRAEIVKELKENPFTAPGPVVGLFHVVVSPEAPDAIEIPVSFDDFAGRRSFKTSFQGSRRSTTCAHLVRTHVVDEITNQMTALMGRRVRVLLAARAATPECASGVAPSACSASRYDLWPQDWTRHLPKPKPDPPPPPERWPVAVRVGIAGWSEMVASGWGSFGISAEGGFRYRAFSIGIEVHGDPPTGSVPSASGGTVSFARASGAILACAHYGLFAGCGLADVGGFIFPNHIQALPASVFYGAVGVRARLEFPISPPRFYIHVGVDLRAPIHPASYLWMGNNIFEAAGLGFGLGAGATFELAP